MQSDNLAQLMTANLNRIGFNDTRLSAARTFRLRVSSRLPTYRIQYGRRPNRGSRRPGEKPNHFADVDQKLEDDPHKGRVPPPAVPGGSIKSQSRVLGRVFTTSMGAAAAQNRGLVPFRVQQLYEEMVRALQANPPDLKRFIAAAGVMAHCVGDACQPLHSSFMHDGDPNDLDEQGRPRARGVHSAYETKMLERHAAGSDRTAASGTRKTCADAASSRGARPSSGNGRSDAPQAIRGFRPRGCQTYLPRRGGLRHSGTNSATTRSSSLPTAPALWQCSGRARGPTATAIRA